MQARAHAVAAVIEDAARQQGVGACPGCAITTVLRRELSLDGLEQVPIEDRGMLARADHTLEVDFADIEPVPQQIGERTSGEGDAAYRPPIREVADFGNDPPLP